MIKKSVNLPVSYIAPLNMNKLRGRMLYLPSKRRSQRDILFIYDRLSSIEESWGVAQALNRFGPVTIPDLPGFGGMESFYKINEKPSINRLADYLASFIKLRYKRKEFTIVAVGFGFVIATRMIQEYPDLAKSVNLLVSINGFSHADDFKINRLRKTIYLIGGWIGSRRLPAPSLQYMGLRRVVLHWYFLRQAKVKKLMDKMGDSQRRDFLRQKTVLWQRTNLRTYLSTLTASMGLDNCRKQVEVPVWHIYSASTSGLNQGVVEQHLRIIFKKYHQNRVNVALDYLSVLDARSAAKLFPEKLRHELSRHKR